MGEWGNGQSRLTPTTDGRGIGGEIEGRKGETGKKERGR